ncbi:MAG TPA: glycosyltransferase family 2 protein [Egibacteraceae bacterium]|nr:glycosyltransferase family 2 protein [Egibacteraceae bacterium]
MRVTACVVSWNDAAHLGPALDSLARQTHPDLEIVVIDNASADDSAAVARSRPDVRLIANRSNLGYSGAANQAVGIARDEHASQALLLCNPDVRLEPDYVSAAVAALAGDSRRAAVQGRLWRTETDRAGHKILDTTGHLAFSTRLFRNRGEGQIDAGQFSAVEEIFGVSGALALYRVAALDDAACAGEVFDADLFAFWEDVDLDWRLQLRGWQAWYEPQARAWHQRGGAGPRRTAVVERLNFANRFLVIAKNDDPVALARALPGVTVTSVLKAGELAVTVPSAFLGSFAHARLLPAALRKRRLIQSRAAVDPASVIQRWFRPFDYGLWARTWWLRVRGPRG